MERYDRYKDSGIEWIGEIPEYWKLARISYIYDSRNTKVSAADYPALSVTMQGIVPQLESAAKTQDIDNRKLVLKGDFVINSRSDRRGSCGISELDGSVTLISNVLAPKAGTKLNRSYFSYLFKSVGFADEFYKVGSGIVDDLWSTNWAKMKNIQICIPPFEDQIKIGHFLDRKTSEIDSLTQKTEKSIELLQEYRKSVISEAVTKGLDPNVPMKDSGVEWIGEIPEGWNICRLKQIATLVRGFGIKKDQIIENGLPCIRYGELYTSYRIKLDIAVSSVSAEVYYGSFHIEPGELVLAATGETKEDIGPVVANATDEDIAVGGDTFLIKNIKSDSNFLAFCLNSEYCKFQKAREANGEIIIHLQKNSVENLLLALPSFDIQIKIADYLTNISDEIDSLIEKKKQLVEKLQEYRKSLISECVTGKVKVPGAE